jgi:hypothetical protein
VSPDAAEGQAVDFAAVFAAVLRVRLAFTGFSVSDASSLTMAVMNVRVPCSSKAMMTAAAAPGAQHVDERASDR